MDKTNNDRIPDGIEKKTKRHKTHYFYKGLKHLEFELRFRYSPHPIDLRMMNPRDDRRSFEDCGYEANYGN